MLNSGMFQSVEMYGVTEADGSLKMQISCAESSLRVSDSFGCMNIGRGLLSQSRLSEGEASMTDQQREERTKVQEEYEKRLKRAKPCMLPKNVAIKIFRWLRTKRRVTARMQRQINDKVERWYHKVGCKAAIVFKTFVDFRLYDLWTKKVPNYQITKLHIQFLDKTNSPWEGITKRQIIEREWPEQLKPGHMYNSEAVAKALRHIVGLDLCSKAVVIPSWDKECRGGLVVELNVKEREQTRADGDITWNFIPGSLGRPTLTFIQPGGCVTLERRNLYGLNRSILGSVTYDNLLHPENVYFHGEYVHPYVDGIDNPRNRTFLASCFNNQTRCNVFTGRARQVGTEDEVPPVFESRVGVKLNLKEKFTPQTKFTYGLVAEEVTTKDEWGAICTNGPRIAQNGIVSNTSMQGPPTTHGGKGIDRVAYLQGNITRDNTRFVNGTPVGTRNIFQWDQGLGIGSKFPFFNRHQLTMTHFKQLWPEDKRVRNKPPPVLVLRGRYGGAWGDLANYEAYNLGGPYSVRGYSVGELGACRKFLELATEIRIPVKNTHVYGFAEYGTDLGSSKDVSGNPTKFYKRVGDGASMGVGVKLGKIRGEYTGDCNEGTWCFSLKFGERF